MSISTEHEGQAACAGIVGRIVGRGQKMSSSIEQEE